jgi:hypothetical protein
MSALQAKNLDPKVHQALHARSAQQVAPHTAPPTIEEVAERARLRGAVDLAPGVAAAVVREQRGDLGPVR